MENNLKGHKKGFFKKLEIYTMLTGKRIILKMSIFPKSISLMQSNET